ncbi:hypothetical protein HW932_18390 [Allochromatium humboldtianum]|uniref:Uncharacterized protein n=1 Tax=Allochromatium humboldtianum TaxID=504901 RepID=A0A850RQP2_9GAMM|nr:hypothetical protein [Allochromatium humboldtianum]NVZ11223.1 hypothetical protein [Allochromatium humboldtianum]
MQQDFSAENSIIRTDGKRSVKVSSDRYGGVDLSFCCNGFQSVTVTVDEDMLPWIAGSIAEFRQNESDLLKALRDAERNLRCAWEMLSAIADNDPSADRAKAAERARIGWIEVTEAINKATGES